MHTKRTATAVAALILAAAIAITAATAGRPPVPPVMSISYVLSGDAGPMEPGCVAHYHFASNNLPANTQLSPQLSVGTGWYTGEPLQLPVVYDLVTTFPLEGTVAYRIVATVSGTPVAYSNTLTTTYANGAGCPR